MVYQTEEEVKRILHETPAINLQQFGQEPKSRLDKLSREARELCWIGNTAIGSGREKAVYELKRSPQWMRLNEAGQREAL